MFAHDRHGRPNSSSPESVGMPRPRPALYEKMEDALRALDFQDEDRQEIEERARNMGSTDPRLGERIGVERCTFFEASTTPLTRTPVQQLPQSGKRSVAYVESFYVSSGRFVQLRRRFPSETELHAALKAGRQLNEPAFWVREVVLPDTNEMVSAALIDAATVIEVD